MNIKLHGAYLDALTILYPVKDQSMRERILIEIKRLIDQFPEYNNHRKRYKASHEAGYRSSVWLPLANLSTKKCKGNPEALLNKAVLIQANPFNSNARFLRVDYSNFPLTRRDLCFSRFWIENIIGDSYESVIDNSKISRIDFAADYINVIPDEIFFDAKFLRLAHANFSQNGKLVAETKNIGSRGKRLIRAYNINTKLKNKGLPLYDTEMMRIEIQDRPYIPLCDIDTYENYFSQIKMYEFSKLIKANHLHPDTVFALKYIGLTAYRQALDKGARKHFDELIYCAKSHWFRPSEIWEKWLIARNKLTILLPDLKKSDRNILMKAKKEFDKRYSNIVNNNLLSIEEEYLSDLHEDED